jgi:multidrug efflux pump subunit AcrA (membrane-fusion protein)
VGGVVVPEKEITFTAQMPGQIVRIAGKEGTPFKAGTVLVALDKDALLAQRQQVAAQVANAQSVVRNAGVQYGRELESPTKSGGSPWGQMMPVDPMNMMGGGESRVDRRASLHSYRSRIDQAQSQLYQAQAKLKEIDAKLRDTDSIAPFDGVLLKKFVERGDTVQPGQPLVSFGDIRKLQIQVDVPARLALGLREGTEVDARLDDAGKTRVKVRIAQIFPMADPTRHTIRIKFDLPRGAPVAAGMYSDVLIPGAPRQGRALSIMPQTAILYRGGLPMAEVVTPGGRTELRLLRLGAPVGQDEIVVLTGVREGERVLVQGRP